MNQKERISPHNIDAEKSVLGSILIDTDSIDIAVSKIPSSDIFYSPKHQIIYEAMLDLFQWKEPIDTVTMCHELSKRRYKETDKDQLQAIGGRVYIVELSQHVVTSSRIEQYIDIVIEMNDYRRIINTSSEIIKNCYSKLSDPISLANTLSINLMKITQKPEDKTFRLLSSYMPKLIDNLEMIQKGQVSRGIKYGYYELDELTGGARNGELIILGGRPKMGKTALMNCIGSNMAENGISVGVFSAETNSAEYTLRTLCTAARLDSKRLNAGKISERDWQEIGEQTVKIENWKYFINDTPNIEINHLYSQAIKLYKENGVQIIFIDYIQKLTCSTKFQFKRDETSYIVTRLKTLAQELQIPVFALSQLNRNNEMRRDPTPKFSDFKDTGQVEQEADLIMAVHRPGLYIKKKGKDENRWKDKAMLIVLGQRNGPVSDIELYFNPIFTRYENLYDSPAEQPELPY